MPIPMPNRVGRGRRGVMGMLGLSLALACGGDNLRPPPPIDPADLYWDLNLSHHAVTLSTTAPYDTLTLTATPRNQAGEPLPGLPAPKYTSTSVANVLVTSEGRVIAQAPTIQPVRVIATLTTDNLKHSDTVFITVVNNPAPPVLASLSIHPVPPDSAKRTISILPLMGFFSMIKTDEPFSGTYVLPLRAHDAAGQLMNDLLVSIRVSDTTVANFGSVFNQQNGGHVVGTDAPSYQGRRPGRITFYASATAYGVTKVDTLPFQFGWPLFVNVIVSSSPSQGPGSFFTTFDPGNSDIFRTQLTAATEIRIGAGGSIKWSGSSPFATEVVFDNPTNVRSINSGNTSLFSEGLDWKHYPNFCADPRFNDGSGAGNTGVTQVVTVGSCSAEGNFVLPPYTGRDPSSGLQYLYSAYRTFPVPGIYEFRDVLNGARGRIIVSDD